MKKYIFILLILFITGCSKNDDDTFLNFSPESSNNILAEIYTFSDGSKLLSQFSNIELKLSEGNIDLTIALQQQLISVEEIIEKWIIFLKLMMEVQSYISMINLRRKLLMKISI